MFIRPILKWTCYLAVAATMHLGAAVEDFSMTLGKPLDPKGKQLLHKALEKDLQIAFEKKSGSTIRVIIADELPEQHKEALASEIAPLLVNVLAAQPSDGELARQAEIAALRYLSEGIELAVVSDVLRISRANQLGLPPTVFDRFNDFYGWVSRYDIPRFSKQYGHKWSHTRYAQPLLEIDGEVKYGWHRTKGFRADMGVNEEGQASKRFIYSKEGISIFNEPQDEKVLSPEERILQQREGVQEEKDPDLVSEEQEDSVEPQEPIDVIDVFDVDDLTLCWAAQRTGIELEGCTAGPLFDPPEEELADDDDTGSQLQVLSPEQRLGDWKGSVGGVWGYFTTSCEQLRSNGQLPHQLLDGRCSYETNDGQVLDSVQAWEAYRQQLADEGVADENNLPALPEEVTLAQVVQGEEGPVELSRLLEDEFGAWEGTWRYLGYSCADYRDSKEPGAILANDNCSYRTIFDTTITRLDDFEEYIDTVAQPIRLINAALERVTLAEQANARGFRSLTKLMEQPDVPSVSVSALIEEIKRQDRFTAETLKVLDQGLAAMRQVAQKHDNGADLTPSAYELANSQTLVTSYLEGLAVRLQTLKVLREHFLKQPQLNELGVNLVNDWIVETERLVNHVDVLKNLVDSSSATLKEIGDAVQAISYGQQEQVWWLLTLRLFSEEQERKQLLEGFSNAIAKEDTVTSVVNAEELGTVVHNMEQIVEEQTDNLQNLVPEDDRDLFDNEKKAQEQQLVKEQWERWVRLNKIWNDIVLLMGEIPDVVEQPGDATGLVPVGQENSLQEVVTQSQEPLNRLEILEEPQSPVFSWDQLQKNLEANYRLHQALEESLKILNEKKIDLEVNTNEEQVSTALETLEAHQNEMEKTTTRLDEENDFYERLGVNASLQRVQARYNSTLRALYLQSMKGEQPSDKQVDLIAQNLLKQVQLWKEKLANLVGSASGPTPTENVDPQYLRLLDYLEWVEFNLNEFEKMIQAALESNDPLGELQEVLRQMEVFSEATMAMTTLTYTIELGQRQAEDKDNPTAPPLYWGLMKGSKPPEQNDSLKIEGQDPVKEIEGNALRSEFLESAWKNATTVPLNELPEQQIYPNSTVNMMQNQLN